MRFVARLSVLVLLAAASWGLYTQVPRFEPVGEELLLNPQLDNGLAGWEVTGRGRAQIDDDALWLRINDAGAGVAVRQPLGQPQRFTRLMLSGELAAQGIHPGPRFWHRGRLVLASFDANERMLAVPHLVADLHGTSDWRRFSAVFKIPPEAHTVRVGAQLIGATGALGVRNLSLREVVERPAFAPLRTTLLIAWLLALAWCLWPLLRAARLTHYPAGAVLGGIAIGTLAPANWRIGIEAWLWRITTGDSGSDTLSQALAVGGGYWGKVGHWAAFALLAILVARFYRHAPYWQRLAALIAIAGVTETLQFFVDSRLPQWRDVGIDLAGVATGLLLVALVRWMLRSSNQTTGRITI